MKEAKTYLWIKTVSRPYYHADDLKVRSDVTYHKIEISKPGKENVALKELFINREISRLLAGALSVDQRKEFFGKGVGG